MTRPATPADVPALAATFNAYLGDGTMQLTPIGAGHFAPLFAPGARAAAFVSVGAPGGAVRGYASVRPYSDRAGYAPAGEVSIYLARDATGAGRGATLYAALLPAAAALGYRYLAARIWASNTGSVAFHARHGFRVVGTQRGIGEVRGEAIDVVWMERVG